MSSSMVTPVGAVTTYTFSNVSANHEIYAAFIPSGTYVISSGASPDGTISPSGYTLVSQGASKTLTITPNSGYRVYNVWVDGSWVGPVTSYTFSNITANHEIYALFLPVGTFAIWAGADSGGSISPPDTVVVSQGASKTLTITPNAGYRVYNVWVDGSWVGPVTSYTFSNITADHMIWVDFIAN